MTRPASARATRGRWRWATPLALLLAGLLLATSATTARGTDLRADRRSTLADLIREQTAKAAAGAQSVDQLRAQVDRLTAVAGGSGGAVEAVRAKAASLSAQAGLTPMTGPGLVVRLDDSGRDPAAALPAGVTPDDLLVHQQDLQAVVNALWAGGAQGVEVMDQRLLSTSAVRCVGNTLILHGRVYSPPFTVAAVGDVAGMRTALATAPALVTYRQWVDLVGLGYRVTAHGRVSLPAYSGELALVNARAVP